MVLTYYFKGDIYPKETTRILFVKTQFSSPDSSLSGLITFQKGEDSDIKVTLETESYTGSVGNLRNSIQPFINTILDSNNYYDGKALEVRLYECESPDGTTHIFHTGSDALRSGTQDRTLKPAEVVSILHKSKYLMYALINYRKALKYPEDRGFSCFRCIESIRQHFKDLGNSDNQSWVVLRDYLNISRNVIDFIKGFADEPRHGGFSSYTDDENSEMLNYTISILDRFLVYLNTDSKLSKETYPELEKRL